MGYNKFVYGGEVKFDLTGDTVTKNTILKGFTAHDKAGEPITGECEFDVNSQDATVAVAEMLDGKTAYARGTMLTGTMPNNGAIREVISSKEQVVTVALGYHDGSGTVGLDPTEMAKLIGDNIREGVTIFDVEGKMSGSEDVKAQSKTVTPATTAKTYTPDEGFNYFGQFTVEAIPYVESDNAAGGKTITVG
jgi:hypothetical protein